MKAAKRSVLVIGATGDQGAAQVAALEAAGYRVSAASRNRAYRPAIPGVRPVHLDLLAPETIAAALRGIDTVFLNLPSASFTEPQTIIDGFEHFLRAAESSRLEKIVFNASLYVGEGLLGFAAHDTRYRIVQRLLAGTVPAIAVCPVIFLENLERGWALPALRERHTLSYPHAEDLPVSWISLADVGRIMIALAGDPAASGRKFVIGGPEPLCGPDTAAALSRAWDVPIRFESLPVADFALRMGELFGGGERSERERIAADLDCIYRWYNEARPSPFTVDMTRLQARYGLQLTSVYRWACSHRLLERQD